MDRLKKFDVPTLNLHGDADQIVPIGAAAMMSAKLVKDEVVMTLADHTNADLLAFLKG
jgi:non-heme chloroperoxidase